MPPVNHTSLTLGVLLSSTDTTIQRAAIGILRQLQRNAAKETPDSLPCHVCGVSISVEELDENGAYTYPDNKPFCPAHYPKK